MKGSGGNANEGLRYATTFEERIFGAKCNVEVIANIFSGESSIIVSMMQPLGREPAFRILRNDLAELSSCVKTARERARVLDEVAEGATDHQLNCSCGGAVLIVVKPPGKPARFTLSIGLFHQEGALANLSAQQIDEAVSRLDTLAEKVSKKILNK